MIKGSSVEHYSDFDMLFRSINEQVQKEALRQYYASIKSNEVKIAKYQHFVKVIYPGFCVSFVALFWIFGLYHYSGED